MKDSKLAKDLDKNSDVYDILKVCNFKDSNEIPQPKYLISPVKLFVLDDLMPIGAFTLRNYHH